MAEAKTTKFKVLDRVKHGGDFYGPTVKGMTTIDLTDDEAAPLLEAGVIEAPAVKGKAAETPPT